MKPIVLPAGTEHVLFGELAHRIADALWPDAGPNDDRLTYACARKNIDEELARAVTSGALPVKDRLTLGPHTFPYGDALNRALVTVDDLREFVAGRGLSVLFQFTTDYGWCQETSCLATQADYDEKIANQKAEQVARHSRNQYTMYEAAEVLAGAYDIGDAMSFLNKRMRPAVESGVLRITDPQDGGPISRRYRPYSDWVTPTAINEWLALDRFSYRWPVPAMKLRQQTAACREPVINGPETRITDTPERMTADLIQFTDYEAGTRTTRNMTQAEHDEELEEKRERHEKGYYTMSEVAQILADAYNLDAVRLLETMKANYHAREIVIRNRSTEAPVLPGHTLRDFYDWMFPDDIRAMLKHWGGPWGSREFPFLTQNSATAQSPATPAPVVTEGASDMRHSENNEPPLDLISFDQALRILDGRFGATAPELAMWICVYELPAWHTRKQFHESELNKPASIGAAIQRLITLNLFLSKSAVEKWNPDSDERFVDYKTAAGLIKIAAKDATHEAEILQEWRDTHGIISDPKRSTWHHLPQIAAHIPGNGFARRIEDGLILESQINIFLKQRCNRDSIVVPVELSKAGPQPLTTNEIANCFAELRGWDVKRWKRELGSPDDWLKACQNRRGTRGRGGYESTWWPVQIAVALVNKDPKSARHLRAKFKRLEPLKPWLDMLKINIPDNSDDQ